MAPARCAAVALVLLASAGLVQADPPAIEIRSETRRFVRLETTGTDGIDAELEATLGELLGRLHLELVHAGAAPDGPIVARVRVESSDRGAVLTVESGQPGVATVRREVERGVSVSVFRETLAHVILGAIEPLALDESAERAPAPLPEPTPEGLSAPDMTPPTDRPRDPTRVTVGARAGPRLLASDRASVAFDGVARVIFGASMRPSVGFHGGYVLPARINRSGVDATFGLIPFRLESAIEPVASRSVALETAILGGIDIVSLSPNSAPPFVHLESSSIRVQPIVGAAVTGRFHLSPNAHLVITTGVDFDAAPRRWDIGSESGRTAFFETARLRPYAALGLDWTMVAAASAATGGESP
jgi:hypothetical protein